MLCTTLTSKGMSNECTSSVYVNHFTRIWRVEVLTQKDYLHIWINYMLKWMQTNIHKHKCDECIAFTYVNGYKFQIIHGFGYAIITFKMRICTFIDLKLFIQLICENVLTHSYIFKNYLLFVWHLWSVLFTYSWSTWTA